MQIISKIFASHDAVLAALKSASPLFVSTDMDGGDHVAAAGLDADGARFDVVITALTTPGVGTIPGPQMPDGTKLPDMPAPPTPTGEIQVDVYWQGDNPPTINGGKTAVNTYLSFDPPMPEEPVENSEPVSWMEFLALFSLDEQIEVATSNDPTVSLFRMMATGLGGDLNLKDPRVTMGLTALEKVGILKPNRKEQILNRIVPG